MARTMSPIRTRRLRDLRRKAGLSQLDLADRSGVSQSTISRLELDGAPNVNLRQLEALARALGVRNPLALLAYID